MLKKTIIAVALLLACSTSVVQGQNITKSISNGGITYHIYLPLFVANDFELIHYSDSTALYKLNGGSLSIMSIDNSYRLDSIVVHGGLSDDRIKVAGIHTDTPSTSIWGYDGNDRIECDTNGVLHAEGGYGNDIIYGSNGFRMLYFDRLNGGPGNDTIYGRGSRDHIDGGPGSDDLYGGHGMDTVNGGEGWDWIDGGDHDDTLIDVHSPLFQNSWSNAPDNHVDFMKGGPGMDKFYSFHEGYRHNWNGWVDHFRFYENAIDYSLFAGDEIKTNVLEEGLLNFLYPQQLNWP